MKGVILCAGKATRMQPFSYTQPKTLLPVANQAVLDHCIKNMRQAGIDQIGVVINPRQKNIIKHVEEHYPDLNIKFIYQRKQKGISHALKMAHSFVGDDSFVLMLGDNLISEPLTTLLQAFEGHQGAILLSEVENPSDFGIASIQEDKIVDLEEKPNQPKSNLAVIGAYVFAPMIFDVFEHLTPSTRGEYEITDAIQWMIDHDCSISFSVTRLPFSDVGTVERWLEANRWMLEQRHGHDIIIGSNVTLDNCKLIGPIVIGENCELRNAVIGPYVSIQSGCKLTDCTIDNSICLEQATISNVKQPIANSIFGRQSRLCGDGWQKGKIITCILGDKSEMRIVSKKKYE